MNCDYIINHYWDKKTKSATLEPQWLSSGEKLSSEQEAIKKLYTKTLGNATYYNKLVNSKKKFEVINGYKIKYTYLTKDDPLSKNGRKVTDISMCIKRSKQLPIKKFLMGIFFIFFLWVFLLNKGIEAPQIQKVQLSKKSQANNHQQNDTVTSKVEKTKKFYICNEDWKKFSIGDDTETTCLQQYLTSYCKHETILSSKKWLQNTNVVECTGIIEFKYNSLKSRTFKRSKKLKKQVKKFLQGSL